MVRAWVRSYQNFWWPKICQQQTSDDTWKLKNYATSFFILKLELEIFFLVVESINYHSICHADQIGTSARICAHTHKDWIHIKSQCVFVTYAFFRRLLLLLRQMSKHNSLKCLIKERARAFYWPHTQSISIIWINMKCVCVCVQSSLPKTVNYQMKPDFFFIWESK